MMDSLDIDVIITWVDNEDPEWIQEYVKYAEYEENNLRFEDLGTLKYIFRGIEKFMPWVRKIHFVTCGHYPEWIDLKNPKLNLVNHDEIFPDKHVLPVFNSCAIEMNLHKIEGLSEKFIYFNDDTFVVQKLDSKYFFTDNLPNDFFIVKSLFHDNLFSHQLHGDMQVINKEIKEDKSFSRQIRKVLTLKYGLKSMIKSFLLMVITKEIPLFALNHHPQAHLKSNFIEVEEAYKNIIEKTRTSRFRSCEDMNQYLFRFWGLIKGKYHPYKHNDTLYIGVDNLIEFRNKINKLEYLNPALICFNEHDGFNPKDYPEYTNILIGYLDSILPQKSLWEI